MSNVTGQDSDRGTLLLPPQALKPLGMQVLEATRYADLQESWTVRAAKAVLPRLIRFAAQVSRGAQQSHRLERFLQQLSHFRELRPLRRIGRPAPVHDLSQLGVARLRDRRPKPLQTKSGTSMRAVLV